MGRRVPKLLYAVAGVIALGVAISVLRQGHIGQLPFPIAVLAIALVNITDWSGPVKGIFAVWAIAFAATLTDLLMAGALGYLFWCAGITLGLFGLADLIAYRSRS